VPLAVVVYLGVVGATAGSVIDAVAWRSQTGQSFVRGRSMCEACRHPLAAVELVPVVSWLIQRGRCRHCRAPISAWSPLVEFTLVVVFVFSALFWPWSFHHLMAITGFVLWLTFTVILALLASLARQRGWRSGRLSDRR
jgi:prepilin signal peptidase PulO-like enzyme (type II secretory pathway)